MDNHEVLSSIKYTISCPIPVSEVTAGRKRTAAGSVAAKWYKAESKPIKSVPQHFLTTAVAPPRANPLLFITTNMANTPSQTSGDECMSYGDTEPVIIQSSGLKPGFPLLQPRVIKRKGCCYMRPNSPLSPSLNPACGNGGPKLRKMQSGGSRWSSEIAGEHHYYLNWHANFWNPGKIVSELQVEPLKLNASLPTRNPQLGGMLSASQDCCL